MNRKNLAWFELPPERWRDNLYMVDSQKQKLYDAESMAKFRIVNDLTTVKIKYVLFYSIEEIQRFVDKLASSAWFKRRWGSLKITVKEKNGHTATANYSVIKLPRWAWNAVVVLHEVAHTAKKRNQGGGSGHGRYFARTFLELTEHVLGKDTAKVLKEEFKRHNVKYLPKRDLSEETREKLRQNFINKVVKSKERV